MSSGSPIFRKKSTGLFHCPGTHPISPLTLHLSITLSLYQSETIQSNTITIDIPAIILFIFPSLLFILTTFANKKAKAMFIFILTYQKALMEVEKYLEAHREYLDVNYSTGKFVASGRQEPRVGGVILCRASNREEAESLVHSDPFYINQIANYQIIEFIPTKHLSDFDKFI